MGCRTSFIGLRRGLAWAWLERSIPRTSPYPPLAVDAFASARRKHWSPAGLYRVATEVNAEVAVTVFVDGADVARSVGEILRQALVHPMSGPQLAEARTVVAFEVTEPECRIIVVLAEDPEIIVGPSDVTPDVTLGMSGDVLDGFLRGRYDLLDGLASGVVTARGRISRVLKVLPSLRPLFPVYEQLRPEGKPEAINGDRVVLKQP